MRLLRLEYGKLSLVEFVGKSIPRYAVLSHTWGADHEEVTFKDIVKGIGKDKAGYGKIRFCRNQVGKDDLQYFWVDTCCIDKSSSAELSEAINSMFRWYHESAKCYVYLSDVSISGFGNDQSFQKSKWFTRGWTLQELIAPASVEFFSKEDQWLGDKQSLEQNLHEVTGIAIQALRGSSLSCFGVDERMSWAAKRQTKRGEDAAYSLLGIFDIHMPLIYGEGREKAMKRLRKEIKQSLKDDSADLSIAFSSREPNQNGEPFFTVPLNEEQKCMLIDSLRFNEIDSRQRTLKYAHVKTCKWLLKNSKYLNWLDPTKMDEHQGFFWIKGKAGTGKSTLMKYALSNTHKTMRNRIIASFFFNARGVDLEKSTTGTYRSLLLQLLEQNPQLQYAFESLRLPSSSIRKDYQWSNESLKALLEQVIRSLGESSAVFFIDALDECEEDQIRDMIAFFENVGEQAVSTGKQLQVCFSSRHYPHITIRNGLELILEGEEGHDQDITSYLNSELKIGNSQTTKQIRQDIQVKASGIFIWVVLVVRILNKEYDRGRIHALRQRLQEIPSDLYDLFVDSLTRDSHNRDELLLSIQWILYAKRPLSPEELYFAVLSETEPAEVSKWDPNEITTDTFQKLILSSSKGLAEITQSTTPTVQFIHESVKDFLLKENGLGKIWPGLGSNLQGQSHERLKECCLNVMNSYIAAHLKLSGSPQNALGPQITAYCLRDTFLFPFLEYAVSNVLYHADIAVGCGIAQEDLFRNFPLVQWIELIDLFEPHEGGRYAQDVSLLYVIADRGMSNLVRAHPSINPCLQWRKESYELPVFASFGQGGNEAFRAFLGADPGGNAQNKPGTSFRFSNQWTVLLGEGAQDTNGRVFKFSSQWGVLSYSAELDNKLILAWLLDTGKAESDSTKDKDGLVLLMWAAQNGHETVVELLVETDKVDVDSKDNTYGQTPLSVAAQNGHERIVKLLLNTGNVEVNSRDDGRWTPLSWAAQNGHEAVVKLLLNADNVEVDSRDDGGRTPLWWAERSGHEAVVQLLQSHLVERWNSCKD